MNTICPRTPHGTHTYGYTPNSHLRSSATSAVHSVSYAYEPYRDVLASLENKVGSTTVSKFEYTVNALGQRTQRAQSGTAFATASTDVFGYNAKGEVTSATNATLPSRDQSFAYDDIGNRQTFTTTAGTTSYTANSLNQYTEASAPFVPSVANPSYDADGNQTATGLGQAYVWDAENRLIAVEPVFPASGDKKVLNTYDGQSRRVRRQVFTYTSGAWDLTTDEKFIYDGWNPIAVLGWNPSTSTFALSKTLTWGLDLSGSFQGAGGVGGLLAVKDGLSVYHYTCDANGNVSEVLNSSGSVVAHYEYTPFGDTYVATGAYAAANEYRFSTKPLDATSGLYYYGFRYYNPSTGRWLSRDPIAERGGVNVFAFVRNAPAVYFDYLGLDPRSSHIGPNGFTKPGSTGETNCLGYAGSGANNSVQYFEPTHPARTQNKDRSILDDLAAEGWRCEKMEGPECKAPCDYEKMVLISYLHGNKKNKMENGKMNDPYADKGVQFGSDGSGGYSDFHAIYSSSGCSGESDYTQIMGNHPAGTKPDEGVSQWDHRGRIRYCCKRKRNS